MSTLTLSGVTLAPVGALDDMLNLRVRSEDETVASPSGVRRYAGGRDRLITTPGMSQRVPFTVVNVARSDYELLVARVGTLQLVRDARGRAVYGTIGAVSGVEWRIDQTTVGQVTFAVEKVTYSEVV